MARGAGGRGGVVFADDPFGAGEVHFVDVGAEGDAVFGFIVDFDLRVVGSHVALAAVFGLADLLVLKAWREWQALQEPSEPSGLMRPMPELGQPVAGSSSSHDLDFGAVALPAAIDGGGGDAHGKHGGYETLVALHDFGEDVVR